MWRQPFLQDGVLGPARPCCATRCLPAPCHQHQRHEPAGHKCAAAHAATLAPPTWPLCVDIALDAFCFAPIQQNLNGTSTCACLAAALRGRHLIRTEHFYVDGCELMCHWLLPAALIKWFDVPVIQTRFSCQVSVAWVLLMYQPCTVMPRYSFLDMAEPRRWWLCFLTCSRQQYTA